MGICTSHYRVRNTVGVVEFKAVNSFKEAGVYRKHWLVSGEQGHVEWREEM